MDNAELGSGLKALSGTYPGFVRVGSLARSGKDRDVWLVEVGEGSDAERAARPAMLVVAGIDGRDMTGSAVMVEWIKCIMARYRDPARINELLHTTTLYIIPRLNPDAVDESFFVTPRRELPCNPRPADDDRDGEKDEDGPEDLNGDGQIAWMRVEDPKGEYVLDAKEPRLLRRADALKGEVGAWRYLAEGVDNDGDETWNEDGPGGVHLDRNFPFGYEYFAPDAGLHPVSEPETRALADFVVAHANIGIVFSFGSADNLLKTPAAGEEPKPALPSGDQTRPSRSRGRRPAPQEPVTKLQKEDQPYYGEFGRIYRENLGLDKELEGAAHPGTFGDWMYFHRGRLSLAAHAWSPDVALEIEKAKHPEAVKDESAEPESTNSKPADKESPKEEAEEKAEKSDAKDGDAKSRTKDEDAEKRAKRERETLAWFDAHAPEAFVPWTPYDHPDFPGHRVEIGGYAPGALVNPPEAELESVCAKQADFLTTLSLRLPRIAVRSAEAKPLSQGAYELTIQIENKGYLPTSLAQGVASREVYPTRLVLNLEDSAFLAGSRTTVLPTIAGSGGMCEVRCTVLAPDAKRVGFEAISMLAGRVSGEIVLDASK